MKPGTRFRPKLGSPSFQTLTDSEVGQVVGVETTAIDPGKHLKLYRQVLVLPVAPGLHPEGGC